MKLTKLVFLASAMALAVSGAYAADKQAKASSDPGFNNLDKNHDGYVSRSEAKADKDLMSKFEQADTNHDGKLSRAEYLKVKGKEDLNTAKEKVEHLFSKEKSDSSAGGTSSSTGK